MTNPTDSEIREAVEELCEAMPEIFSEHPGTPGNPDEIYSIGGIWWFHDDATPRGALPIIAECALAELAREEIRIVGDLGGLLSMYRNRGVPYPDGFGDCWTRVKMFDVEYDLSILSSRALAEIRACTEAARMMENES